MIRSHSETGETPTGVWVNGKGLRIPTLAEGVLDTDKHTPK